jgi:AcrR family transcriptional regulator
MIEAAGAARGGRGARDRIAGASATLFARSGIHATGVEALVSAAGVSKRTFYQHFPSKDELVRSYLRTLDEGGGTVLERQLDRFELTPRERLLAIFDARPVDRFRGCPFHNAAVESAGVVDGVDEIVRDHKLRFAQRLSDVAAEAGAADPRQLGNQLLVLFEGATALATSLNDTAPLVHARAAAATLIDRVGAQ